MYEADKKYGLNVESLKKEYDAKTEQPTCNVEFSPEEAGDADEYTKISLSNLFFPFIFFGSFAIAAFGLQLYDGLIKKKRRKRGMYNRTWIGRKSALGVFQSFTKENRDKNDDPDFPDNMNRAAIVAKPADIEGQLQLDNASFHTADEPNRAQDVSEHLHAGGRPRDAEDDRILKSKAP